MPVSILSLAVDAMRKGGDTLDVENFNKEEAHGNHQFQRT
jgi:hypothetical protein